MYTDLSIRFDVLKTQTNQ